MSEYRLVWHRSQWSLAYTDPERGRVRVSTGTDDRGLAEARAGAIWRTRQKPKSERVADLWEPYVTDRIGHGVSPKRFSLWKALEPHFGYKVGTAITKGDCRSYIEARRRIGRTNSTIRTELELLRACLRWHYGDKAPEISAPPPSKPRDRYLTKLERDKLLGAIETPHVKLFVTLALTTGARMSALLDLTWDRVDFAHGTIDLNPAGRGINNKRRTVVPMNGRARQELEAAYQGRLSDYVVEYAGKQVLSVKKAIASAARRSGVPCSPHVFRHTAAVWMAEADVPMDKIAQFLGHTTTRVTYATYARFSPRYMADGAAALDW